MFYSLTGNILLKESNTVAVDCGGVGFKCSVSLNTVQKTGPVGSKVTLYTHLAVREDALELFGFFDTQELDCFKMLIGISGVGPKAALAVLSELTPDRLALAVTKGDAKAVTKAQGVGPKIAQRIVLELKGKLSVRTNEEDGYFSEELVENNTSNAAEAVSALQFLGYSQYEASKAVRDLSPDMTVENMIKKALAVLSKNI